MSQTEQIIRQAGLMVPACRFTLNYGFICRFCYVQKIDPNDQRKRIYTYYNLEIQKDGLASTYAIQSAWSLVEDFFKSTAIGLLNSLGYSAPTHAYAALFVYDGKLYLGFVSTLDPVSFDCGNVQMMYCLWDSADPLLTKRL